MIARRGRNEGEKGGEKSEEEEEEATLINNRRRQWATRARKLLVRELERKQRKTKEELCREEKSFFVALSLFFVNLRYYCSGVSARWKRRKKENFLSLEGKKRREEEKRSPYKIWPLPLSLSLPPTPPYVFKTKKN